jgi:NADH:ubiquinone oxidoreductase subunit K
MSLANFERFFDRIAPTVLLVLGLTVAAATAVVGA